MLWCSAMPVQHGWQKPVVDLGNNKEESRACNFQQPFGACQASSDACWYFAIYDTKSPTIWVHKTKLRNRINKVKKKNLLAGQENASLAERYCLCSSVFLWWNLTGKRLVIPVRNIFLDSKYLLNPYHISKSVNTTKFRNVLQQIDEWMHIIRGRNSAKLQII